MQLSTCYLVAQYCTGLIAAFKLIIKFLFNLIIHNLIKYKKEYKLNKQIGKEELLFQSVVNSLISKSIFLAS